MTTDPYQALRQSCIQLVEAIDKTCRTSDRAKPADNAFDSTVVRTMRELASIQCIKDLRGRVREARPAEIIAAMSTMAQVAADKKGISLVDSLADAANKSGKPEVAGRLTQLQADMLRKHKEQAAKN